MWKQSGDEKPIVNGILENFNLMLDILSTKKSMKVSDRMDDDEVLGSADGVS